MHIIVHDVTLEKGGLILQSLYTDVLEEGDTCTMHFTNGTVVTWKYEPEWYGKTDPNFKFAVEEI